MPMGGVMPGQMPMGRPNPMMMRAAALRGGPPPQMPMAQPSGGLPGVGGMMGNQMSSGGLPGVGGMMGNQMPNQVPQMPRPMPGPGPMQAPQMPRPQLPGPRAGPAQNLWAGPSSY